MLFQKATGMNLNNTFDKTLTRCGNHIHIYFSETNYYAWADFGYRYDGQFFVKKGSM